MHILELITLERLKKQAGASSFQRGEEYAREGRVANVQILPQIVNARVDGQEPYFVVITPNGQKLGSSCTCPLGISGVFCKHCVAVCLIAGEHIKAEQAAPLGPFFKTDAELESFVDKARIAHVRQLGGDVLLPYFPESEQPALRYVLNRARLLDLSTAQALKRYGYYLQHAYRAREQLPSFAHQFLQSEKDDTERARTQVRFRTRATASGDAGKILQLLLAYRGTFDPATPPRADEVLRPARLHFDGLLPGFHYDVDRSWVPEKSTVPYIPAVDLIITEQTIETRCTCRGHRCLHALAAIDTALTFFALPEEKSAGVVRELVRPAWERTLSALDSAFDAPKKADGATVLTFRVALHEEDQLEVHPYLHKLTRKGTLSSGTRTHANKIIEQLGDALSVDDERILQLCARTFGYANQQLLEALTGHPRIYLDAHDTPLLRVEKVRVGLTAEHRGNSVVLLPSVDGSVLPERYWPRVRSGREERRPFFFYDSGTKRLTVLEVTDVVRRTMDVLASLGNDFPPESHAALVEKLSRLSSRVPVAMPRSVMGEQIPPSYGAVLRLRLEPDSSVKVELMLKPLPESAAFTPGDGPKDVHVRRDSRPVHAKRDFEQELRLAEDLIAKLPALRHANVEPGFSFTFSRPEDALVVLASVEELEKPRPQLEWVNDALRLTGKATAATLKVQLDRKRDWFGVTGALKLGEDRIDLAIVLDAARRQERFIRAGQHTYVELTEELRRQLQQLSDHTYRSSNGIEMGPSGAEALDSLAEAGANVEADKEWQRLTQRIFASKELLPRVPKSFKGELRDYQLEGYQWLVRLASWGAGGVLADDMGLGKTVQALALLLERAKDGPALVIAPTSVGFNWLEECERFAPSLNVKLYAASEDRGLALEKLKARDVLVLSYGLLARDAERLSKVNFSTIIFDEAQALKNPGTLRARAAYKLQASFRCALSGTPIENHLGELWSMYRAVFPGLLGSWDAFRDRYATPIEKKLDPTAAPALARVLKPFLLRRTKGQVAQELPPRTDIRVPIVLSAEEWELYEDARLAAVAEIEMPSKLKDQQRRIQILASLTRLRLVASHPRLYDPSSDVESSKLRRMMELIEELTEEGHRALVFSQFTSHLALVRELLDARGFRYLYLDGTTPAEQRPDIVRSFQAGAAPLFLISLKAGGFGLNLTAADYVIHLDPWWNPAVEDQASDRAHRIGQDRPVTVYRLVAKGTIEEQILKLHEEKRELVSGVLDGKDQAGRLSNRELLELLTQRPGPVDEMEPPSSERH